LTVPTNNVTKKDIEQIKIKLNFNIITFHEENNVMNLIYVSNDTVKHSRCRITQEGLKLELDEVLDNSYSNKKFSYTVADKKGYYLYMKEKQVIEYVPY